MSIGIDIIYRDGGRDSVDPVIDFTETADEFIFHTDRYQYAYPKIDVARLKPYDPEGRS